MPNTLPNFDIIRQKYPELYPALEALSTGQQNIARQTNTDPSRPQPAAPTQIAGITVSEKDGHHDVQITDNSPAYPGIGYHAYYSRDKQNWHRVDLGSAKNTRVNLGGGKYFWAADSGYTPASRSPMVYHGGPIPKTTGTGSYVGPELSSSQNTFGAEPIYRNSAKAPVRG
jgi:hypothetical protein